MLSNRRSRSASGSSVGASSMSGKRWRTSETIVAISGAPGPIWLRSSSSGRERTYCRSASMNGRYGTDASPS